MHTFTFLWGSYKCHSSIAHQQKRTNHNLTIDLRSCWSQIGSKCSSSDQEASQFVSRRHTIPIASSRPNDQGFASHPFPLLQNNDSGRVNTASLLHVDQKPLFSLPSSPRALSHGLIKILQLRTLPRPAQDLRSSCTRLIDLALLACISLISATDDTIPNLDTRSRVIHNYARSQSSPIKRFHHAQLGLTIVGMVPRRRCFVIVRAVPLCSAPFCSGVSTF